MNLKGFSPTFLYYESTFDSRATPHVCASHQKNVFVVPARRYGGRDGTGKVNAHMKSVEIFYANVLQT